MMKNQEKKRIIGGALIVGLICIMMVVLAAYGAELRCENNELMAANEALQGEIDTLNIKIKSANNIDHIESVATKKLGMVYPSAGECVYVTSEDVPESNFAMVIKEQAYH